MGGRMATLGNKTIVVQGVEVHVTSKEDQDYISLTDMTKAFPDGETLIKSWRGHTLQHPLQERIARTLVEIGQHIMSIHNSLTGYRAISALNTACRLRIG